MFPQGVYPQRVFPGRVFPKSGGAGEEGTPTECFSLPARAPDTWAMPKRGQVWSLPPRSAVFGFDDR